MHSNNVPPVLPAPSVLTLRRAVPGDLPALLALFAEAADWLNRQGVRQWPVGGFPAARIEPLIAAGTQYVLCDGPAVAATVAVDDHADPEFWGPADDPGAALYVHKLAVARRYAGWGLGEALLDWAGRHAQAAGRRWLRLDCAKANPRLQDYYRSRGFRHLRTVDLPHRASGALFQRPAGPCSAPLRVPVRDLTASGRIPEPVLSVS